MDLSKLSTGALVVSFLFQLSATGEICQGVPGFPGRDGRDGKDGTPGTPGPAGPPGTSAEISHGTFRELKEMLTEEVRDDLQLDNISELQDSVAELAVQVQDSKRNTSYLHGIVEDLQQNLEILQEKSNCCSSDSDVGRIKGGANVEGTCPQNLQQIASSCKEVYECNPDSPSGYYWRDSVPPELMYCAMNLTRCGNITGGWTRVAHINMTNPYRNCPAPLETVESPRSCASGLSGGGCSSLHYSTSGVPYTQVCGQAIGYQYRGPNGFFVVSTDIDSVYVDGLSITYGSNPRHHLWTYAVAHSDSAGHCPCAGSGGDEPPSFVQDHYYCESGNVGAAEIQWYCDDPLWDGKGCPAGNTCCDPPNLPWFHRTLDTSTTADLELRLCHDQPNQPSPEEDVAVELFELYVY